MLEVIAGDDGYDPRIRAPKLHPYSQMLDGGVKGMKIGIVREGFEQATAEAAVNEKVRAGAKEVRRSRRAGLRGLDSHAHDRASAVDADRHRGSYTNDDVGRRLWPEPTGPLFASR